MSHLNMCLTKRAMLFVLKTYFTYSLDFHQLTLIDMHPIIHFIVKCNRLQQMILRLRI